MCLCVCVGGGGGGGLNDFCKGLGSELAQKYQLMCYGSEEKISNYS